MTNFWKTVARFLGADRKWAAEKDKQIGELQRAVNSLERRIATIEKRVK